MFKNKSPFLSKIISSSILYDVVFEIINPRVSNTLRENCFTKMLTGKVKYFYNKMIKKLKKYFICASFIYLFGLFK